MINKVKLLKSIGKFYDYASKGAGLDWHKNTFFFAPNAYGKTTFVKTLLTALAVTRSPNELHIYALDFGRGGLKSMRALPHLGQAVFSRGWPGTLPT